MEGYMRRLKWDLVIFVNAIVALISDLAMVFFCWLLSYKDRNIIVKELLCQPGSLFGLNPWRYCGARTK
jgi:hypothetical protein